MVKGTVISPFSTASKVNTKSTSLQSSTAVGISSLAYTGTTSTGALAKLLDFRKTPESQVLSPASATTILIWYSTQGVTIAIAVKTVVKPSKPTVVNGGDGTFDP